MLYTFYSDCHLYTPVEIPVIPKTREKVLTENAYSLGDNLDVRCCPKSKKDLMEKDLVRHRDYLFLDRYVYGNHELPGMDVSKDFLVVGDILMTHGDIISWGDLLARADRCNKPYRGFGPIRRIVSYLEVFIFNKISNFEVGQALKYCQFYKCKTIVYGHSHRSCVIEKTVNGIRIINVPRGKTELDL